MKKKKRMKTKLHNIILGSLTVAAGFIFVFSVCCLDSDSYVPGIMVMLSMSWLAVVAYANGLMCGVDDVD